MKTDTFTEKKSGFEKILKEEGVLVYSIVGVSMLPMLKRNRDLVVLRTPEPESDYKLHDVVLFKRKNGQYVLHRILKIKGDSYWIVGDNCVSGEIVKKEQILAVLTEFTHKGRQISVDDKNYLRYVRYWCAPWRIRFPVLRVVHFIGKCMRWIKRHLPGSA